MYILFEYVIDKIGDFKYWLKHLNDPEVVTNNNSCRCASHIFPNMETQKK